MSQDLSNLLNLLILVVGIVLVITIIVLIVKNIKKSYSNTLIELERNKNLIISGAILSELNKVESLINNKELEEKYNYWKSIFKTIKDIDIPKITDELIEAEEQNSIKYMNEGRANLAKIDFEIYMHSNMLIFTISDGYYVSLYWD